MTQLLIKLHQPMARGNIEDGAVATVRQTAVSSGAVTKAWWAQEKPVAIAGGSGEGGEYTVFDLPGGGYYGVDITLPRGADISKEYLVEEGAVRTETIKMDASPHEYLGWQQYAGIVRSNPYRRETERGPALLGAPGTARLDLLVRQGNVRIDKLYEHPKLVPEVFATGLPASIEAWALVGQSPGGAAWARAGGPQVWQPTTDEEFTVWFRSMPTLADTMVLIDSLRRPEAPLNPTVLQFPRWLSFGAVGQIDLASVPWAWWGDGRNPDEEISFLWDRVRPSPAQHNVPGHLTISVHDRRWFGLLEFLASGRLSRAGNLLDQVLGNHEPEQALYGKVKGPLVAVAGGIVLIARAPSTDVQPWDQWLENLSNWFPGIPDGPILLGCRRLQQATNPGELLAAFDHLREGIERGLPFFSASIRMLSLALSQIGPEIVAADVLGRYIAPVSARVDPNQPFTVIRL